MKTFTLEQLREFASTAGAEIVYHGTSSSYCERIESRGWPLDGHPFSWDDIEFVCDLATELKEYGDWWIGSGLARKNRGASFTGRLDRAISYAQQCPGGESLHSTLYGARAILARLRANGELGAACSRLAMLIAAWQPLVENSVPVVYAVRGTAQCFPEVFKFYAGLEQANGGIDTGNLILEAVAHCDVPVHSIVGRTFLEQSE